MKFILYFNKEKLFLNKEKNCVPFRYMKFISANINKKFECDVVVLPYFFRLMQDAFHMATGEEGWETFIFFAFRDVWHYLRHCPTNDCGFDWLCRDHI